MIKIGIIGCGNVSQTYLYTLSKNKDAEVVALADIDLSKAKKHAEIFNIKSIYSDYKEMIDKESLDAVIIATPHFLHHDQAIACAKNSIDILCEKPLATNMKDTVDMINKCSNVRFGVMLQRRFYPNSIAVREVIRQGLLGEITEVSLDFSCHKTPEFYDTWRGKKISGGGTLISQALHRIDLLVYFFGEPQFVEGIIKTTRPYIEVEDYAKGKIYFKNSIVADLESNNSSGNPETISIIKIKGTNGHIILSDDKALEWNVDYPKPEEVDINKIPIIYRPAYYGPCHEMVIDDFVDSIKNNRQPSVTGKDSLAAMKIIFGFYSDKLSEDKRIRI